MSTIPGCGNCNRPVHDGAAMCSTCTTGLRGQLLSVPGLLEDLVVTLTKQDRLSTRAGGVSSEPPLPARLDIPDAVHHLGNELTTWARVIAEHHQLDRVDVRRAALAAWTAKLPRRPDPARVKLGPLSSCELAACWLAEHAEWIRLHPAALEAHGSITSAIDRAAARTDRRTPQVYRGTCANCQAEMRATPRAATVTCTRCGEVYDGEKTRAWLLKEAADQLVTAAELSAALTGWAGRSVAVGTIKSWKSRGQIAPHAWLHRGQVVTRPLDKQDRPLYRVGDGVELVEPSVSTAPGLHHA